MNLPASLDLPHLLALAATLGLASGLRLYAAVFLTGLAGHLGWVALPPGLAVLQSPVLLGGSALLMAVEFLADKVPWVDSVWDMANSVLRVPAGAALAAAAMGADGAAWGLVAALMGGTLAATSQAAKTTTRAAINTSPEPFSNWGASLLEDGLVVGALWLAYQYPLVFGVALLVTVVLMWFITWALFRFLRAAFRRVRVWFAGTAKET